MVSELTQVTENTEFTEISTKTKEFSQSSASLSTSSSSQSNKAEQLEVDIQTEYTSSRITYDTKQKKITIESDVLDADIIDDLYDNNIKPLALSEKIHALQVEIEHKSSDNSSWSNAPSPKNLSQSNRKETESTNLYYGYPNNNHNNNNHINSFDASTVSTITTLPTTPITENNKY